MPGHNAIDNGFYPTLAAKHILSNAIHLDIDPVSDFFARQSNFGLRMRNEHDSKCPIRIIDLCNGERSTINRHISFLDDEGEVRSSRFVKLEHES